jgi:hypothetical protein
MRRELQNKMLAAAPTLLALSGDQSSAASAGEQGRYCLDGVCRSTCILDTCLWVSTSKHYGIIEAENGFHVPIAIRI